MDLMASASRRTGRLLLLAGAGLAVAVAALAVFGALLPVFVDEPAAPGPVTRAARVDEVQAALDRAHGCAAGP